MAEEKFNGKIQKENPHSTGGFKEGILFELDFERCLEFSSLCILGGRLDILGGGKVLEMEKHRVETRISEG